MSIYDTKFYSNFQPYITDLEKHCKKKGIFLSRIDDNIVFVKEDKKLSISCIFMFRQSGIKSVHREKGENMVEMVDVTDEMFYENYVKATINLFFK